MTKCYLCNKAIIHSSPQAPERRIACHSCGKALVGEDPYVFFCRPFEPNGYLALDFQASFVVDDEKYICAEQFVQVKKAEFFDDHKMRAEILSVDDPKTHRDLGRKIKNFSSYKWQNSSEYGIPYCSKVVTDANLAKFSFREDLRSRLLYRRQKNCFCKSL